MTGVLSSFTKNTNASRGERMDWTIAKRLWLMVAAALSALLVVAAGGSYLARQYDQQLVSFDTHTLRSMDIIGKLERGFFLLQVTGYTHIVNNEFEKMEAQEKLIEELKKGIDENFAAYEKMLVDEQDKILLDNDRKVFYPYASVLEEILELSRRNDQKVAARELAVSKWKDAGDKVSAALLEHTEYNLNQAKSASKQATENGARGLQLSWLVSLIAAVVVGGLGYFLIRGIGRSLKGMQDTVALMESQLDFTLRLPVQYNDEIGKTASAFNSLIVRLQENFRTIALGTQSVAASVASMASASRGIAEASEQQSYSASSMASSIEQMTVSIAHVGDRAAEANSLSLNSGELAVSGGKVIGQTVQDISEISVAVSEASEIIRKVETQSDRISTVVQVIQEVADQTNLLALNAAIEAARAGEQGRGFAVVADEVRKLAERTASSTREISSTISEMRSNARAGVESIKTAVECVSAGVSRAEGANKAIVQIGESSAKTVEMVEEISNAIREQRSASSSIASMVEKVAQMAEESSAGASKGASAASELEVLASDLLSIVTTYKV